MEINIFTCKYGYYLSLVLKYILEKENYKVNIVKNIDLKNINLYIILFSQKVEKYPKNYIIYNLEQKDISKWINKKFELSILFSKRSWDYSNLNISKFDKLLQKKLILFQLPLIEYNLLKNINNNTEDFHILFYGTMNNHRTHILNFIKHKINKKYKIKIINNVFGENLFKYIEKSKIILNISYYKEALLECYRINEAQSCKKLVISFLPNKNDYENYNYYSESVVFVDSITSMIEKIDYYLINNNEYLKKIKNIKFLKDTKFIHNLL
tara:strand:+ start:110 stop:913 length:804 start_codon:yes stop_codon:yes gene_type:complete